MAFVPDLRIQPNAWIIPAPRSFGTLNVPAPQPCALCSPEFSAKRTESYNATNGGRGQTFRNQRFEKNSSNKGRNISRESMRVAGNFKYCGEGQGSLIGEKMLIDGRRWTRPSRSMPRPSSAHQRRKRFDAFCGPDTPENLCC